MRKTLSVRLHVEVKDLEELFYSAAPVSSYWCEDAEQLGFESVVKKILEPGANIKLRDGEDNGKSYELNYEKLKRGLKVIAKKYPKHFADIYNDCADGITADVFLQCCVLGEVKYS